ncbi:uncharacterized protein [Cicer arietinum]|uniref:uncharacterized protein n=1 Tax=Cicer arietinum TaxID=3827 RepID=UPI003CC5A4C1
MESADSSIVWISRSAGIIDKGFEDLGANPTEEQRSRFKENKKNDCKAIFILNQCIDTTNFDKNLMQEVQKKRETFWRSVILVEPRFDYVVCAIEESKDISELSLEELQGTLEDDKGGKHKEKEEDEACAAQECSSSNSDTILLLATTNGERSPFSATDGEHIDTSRRSKIRFAYDRTLEAKGAGDMVIKRRNGKTIMIENVLFVPEMKSNLLNIGQLIQKGFKMIMKNDALEMYDGQKKMILKAPLSKNRTFVINIQAVDIQCLKAASSIDEN